MKNLFFSCLTILSLPILSFAQGTISGTILDEKYAEPLIGANVVIEGTATGTSTDFDGKYQFSVEAGTYNVVVSYIGYQDKTITDVVVKDGEVTYLDAAITDEAQELGLDVVVTAKSLDRSENALMMLQKKSDKIQDGISSQEMSRFSVSNAAGAMQKVTGATVSGGKYIYIRGLGDRYSLTQLNGLVIPSADPYRNSAQLDLIPSNLLDNIITAKTFTPDQPGTFTGGAVNIKTKSFPEQFSLTFSVSSSYNSQNNGIDNFLTHPGGANDYFGYDDGTRALPEILNSERSQAVLDFGNNIPRIARSKSFYDRFAADSGVFSSQEDFAQAANDVATALSTDFTPDATSTPIDHGFGFSLGNQFQLGNNALGLIAAASFKTQYRHLDRFEKANWRLEDINTGTLFNQGDFEETLSTETPTVNGMLGLAYKLGGFNTISFNALYNHSADKTSRFVFGERPDNLQAPRFLEGRSLSFNERELVNLQLGGEHVMEGLNNLKVEWKVSQAKSTMVEPDTRFFENDINIETGDYDIPASDVQRPFHFFRDLADTQYDAKLDITIPFGSRPGNKVKVGGLFTTKDRTFTEQRFQVEEHFGFTRPFEGDPDDFLADDNVGLISEGTNPNSFIIGNFIRNRSLPKNTYAGTDEVTAFYAMTTYSFTDRLKFIGGARYEKTNLFVESADESQPIGRIDQTDILPSINLVYSLTDNMNLRSSFSNTLARPNLREIAPFEAFDPLTKEIFFGNPELDRTKIDNFDLRWEWFMNAGELFAVSGYYKNFEDPIVLFYRDAPSAEIQFTNVPQAELYGLEFEFRKDLASMIPALK
ncbi:MAG: TonB-dependent receptor, partial [Bacteroidota bacterium]